MNGLNNMAFYDWRSNKIEPGDYVLSPQTHGSSSAHLIEYRVIDIDYDCIWAERIRDSNGHNWEGIKQKPSKLTSLKKVTKIV